jgi:hypothetical protein
MTDDEIGYGEDLRLFDPALDMRVRRHGAELGKVEASPGGQQDAHVEILDRLQRGSVDASSHRHAAHDCPERHIDKRGIRSAPPVRQRLVGSCRGLSIANGSRERGSIKRSRKAGQVRRGPQILRETPLMILEGRRGGPDRPIFRLREGNRDLRNGNAPLGGDDRRRIFTRLSQDEIRPPSSARFLHRWEHRLGRASTEQLSISED